MTLLEGPRVKITRARNQINSLENEARTFFEARPYRVVVGELNGRTGRRNIRIVENRIPPSEWGVIVGEIVHDLRSSLDEAICALALITDPTRDVTFCERMRTNFPLYLYGPAARMAPKAERFGRNRLRYLREDFVSITEEAQPYKRRNRKKQSPLWLLHELNNSDKHRTIPIVEGKPMALATASDSASLPNITLKGVRGSKRARRLERSQWVRWAKT